MRKSKIQTLIRNIFLFSVIPLFILLFILLTYSIQKNEFYNNELVKRNESIVTTSLNRTLNEIEKGIQTAIQGSRFLYFTNTRSIDYVKRYSESMLREIQENLNPHEELVGTILYHREMKRTYNAYSNLAYASLNESITSMINTLPSERTVRLTEVDMDGHPLLLYYICQRYGAVLALIDPAKNNSFQSFYANLPENTLCRFSMDSPDNITGFTNLYEKTKDAPLYLNYLKKNSPFLFGLDTLQICMLLIIFLMLSAISFMWLFLRNRLLVPLNNLLTAFRIVSGGDLSYRLDGSTKIDDINTVYSSFNRMLDHIRDAENESHRQKMDAVQAKLQYLQLQIRPHFYLNCLKNINSLAAIHEDEKIQELVIFLSDYFRYNFQDVKNFVSIRDELEASQSYVNLCRCLYYHLDLTFDIDSRTLSAKCLPLSLLTFVENAIKHTDNMNLLSIHIQTELITDKEDPFCKIVIKNTGEFSEEALESLNKEQSPILSYSKDHVGISNVRYRLWLIYGDEASLDFHNENGQAVVTLCFPFELINEP